MFLYRFHSKGLCLLNLTKAGVLKPEGHYRINKSFNKSNSIISSTKLLGGRESEHIKNMRTHRRDTKNTKLNFHNINCLKVKMYI